MSVIDRAQAWIDAAEARGINMTDKDGYLAIIRDLLKIAIAAEALAGEAQEYAMDFGLGCAAPLSYWEDLWNAQDEEGADAAIEKDSP